VDGVAAEARVLFETHEIIIRQPVGRRFPLESISNPRAVRESLIFESDGVTVELDLGLAQAKTWAAALIAGPPSLAHKLGVSDGARAWVIGPLDDAELKAALQGRRAASAEGAAMTLAMVETELDLAAALAAQAREAPERPFWIVHRKGPKATFGEVAVRSAMRTAGYMDTKVSSVSDAWSATRYALKRG
jgi:hypothetical protein